MSTQVITTEGWVDYVYRIWDRKQELFWTSPRGKRIWNRPGDAKNAWNMATGAGSSDYRYNSDPAFKSTGGREYFSKPRFSEQSRFVVRKFRLTFVEES